jgi:hypothetical protein
MAIPIATSTVEDMDKEHVVEGLKARAGHMLAKAYDESRDVWTSHLAHAMGCKACDQHAAENYRLGLEVKRLKAKNKKLRKRIRYLSVSDGKESV